MADRKSKKRAFVEISSSSSFSSSEESESVIEEFSSDSCTDDDYDEDDDANNWSYSENEDEDEGHADEDDEASTCNKIIEFLQGRGDLQELKLVECKVYLRRHGLRLSGTKEECIERIKEHWRLKDGNGEALYPRSSFTINCTGDVCKGDVVLFNQRVYESFNKMRRHGNVLGRRTVVGRIVKESYGAAKQQHTFTVEVLWSKGTKKLAPLSPLLVKGRNLYKMKTFRQHWKNERERLNVLAEKHMRGAAARSIKAKRKSKMEMKRNKSLAHEGNKRRKHFHKLHPSGTKETDHLNKNPIHEPRKSSRNKKHNPRQNFPPLQELRSKHPGDCRHPTSHFRHQNLKQSNQAREPFFHPNNNRYQNSYTLNPRIAERRPHHFAVNPLRDSSLTPFSESREFNQRSLMYNAYPHFTQVPESSRFGQVLGRNNVHPQFYVTNRWR
ncbi:uncharacterized protein [Henckelia pumila]|uniref:uncharacterized protein n=1 Tax=Henckelia pumila TaxID=405737 RepID=UPI003C6E57C7